MYCEKCNKQSPENFKHCAYCGAAFHKKKKEHKENVLINKIKSYRMPTMKSRVLSLITIAIVLSIAAIITGVLTGSKPDALVKTFTHSIEQNDEELFFTLFDEQIKSYNKEYLYFDDEVVLTEMTHAMRRSNEFYKLRCGEEFKLSYIVDSVVYIEDEELEEINELLVETYLYEKTANKGAKLSFTINAKGDSGEYQSIYNDIYAIRIGGKWYLTEKAKG
ncbi:MAG: hypothetical protein E7556_05655 [Ruminococcaceae bacterium]|nr:hypothetical protein [Oscillospiraceae bacterium]